MSPRRLAAPVLGALVALLAAAGAGAAETSRLRGRVTAGGLPAPAAVIAVAADPAGQPLGETTTDGEGRYRLTDLAPGRVRVTARLAGFVTAERRLELSAGAVAELDLALVVEGIAEYVEVSQPPRAADPATAPGPVDALDGLLLERSPTGAGSVEEALAAVPGVARSSAGIGIRGGQPTQTGMQLGSMNLTDPVTGEARLRVPVDAVAGVEVLASPTAAEFGRFAAGLVVLHPRTGSENWRFALNNLEPALRTRRGEPLEVLGVRSFAPRLSLLGPLRAGRLYLAQSLQYRYTVSDVESRSEDELRRQEFLSSVTRLDLRLGPRHHAGLVLTAFPETRESVNLSTFDPPQTTWDQRTSIYNVSLTEDAVIGSSAVLSSGLHLGRQELRLWPPEPGVMELRPLGNDGRYFNRQWRKSTSLQLVESLSFVRRGPGGDHELRLGFDLLRVDFTGDSADTPVEVYRLDGSLARRIRFAPPASYALASTDLALFVRDRWRPRTDLVLELALRLDHDGVLGGTVAAPRLGVAFTPAGGRWTLAASGGVFTERTPSLAGVFEQLEARSDERYAADGRTLTARHVYRHESAPDLRAARSATTTARVTWQPAPWLELKASGLVRHGRHELVVDPRGEGSEARLLLSSDGESRYRELELATRLTLRAGTELHASWIRSRSEADLNAFTSLFGTARAPVIRPNEHGLADTDRPARLLLRLASALGERWTVTALVDWRRGFPWSALAPDEDYAGPRNTAGRFPDATLVDVAVERRFRVAKWRPWIGLGVVNLLDDFVPRDVQAHVEAPDYGAFYDSPPRRLRFFVRLVR